LRNTPGHTKGYKLTAGDLADSLAFFLGRPVIDKTGLTGRYDVELVWTPESVQTRTAPTPDPAPPPMAIALQLQLGLKLEPAKGRIRMFVIDSVERPSDN
jgi:uncharacterized protein (TIGR03435 family)